MIIGSVLRLMKQARHVKSVMKQYQDVLSSGSYRLFDNFRSVCLNDPAVYKQAQQTFPVDAPSPIRTRVAAFLNKINYFTISSTASGDGYDAVYVANNYDTLREVKLFSFRQKKLLTLCTGPADMEKQLQEYEMLQHAYPMPRVAKNERFSHALDVAMIDRLAFPGNDRALTAIAQATAAYNPDPALLVRKPVAELIAFSYSDETMRTCLNALTEEIHRDVLSAAIPLCLQHGDLSKDNLIFGQSEGETAFWWIDWEHQRERLFFYDYFFYIINSALYSDTGAFSTYISGENDETLKAYFSHFGFPFDPDKKWDYFLVFVIVFLKERVCDLGHVSALVRYCDLIKKLKSDK